MQLSPERAEAVLAWTRALRPGRLRTPEQLLEAAKNLSAQSAWQLEVFGRSAEGRELLALHWPGRRGPVLAYGYPHPDEPTGALALLALAEALPSAPSWLQETDWWLVLCADPDQAQRNAEWIARPSLRNYLRSNWRPLYSGLEVDYHYPIHHRPFYQPRDRSLPGLEAPLPESVALSDLMRRVRPRLLGLMHGNHVSGVYSYLSHRPGDSLVAAYDRSTEALGLARHLGERADPGRRWRTARPDLLREPRLEDRRRKAEAHYGPLEGRLLAGCASAAQFLESLDEKAVVLTPEVGLWQAPNIDDLSASGQTRRVRISRLEDRRGWREQWHGELVLPDGSLAPVLYHSLRVDGPARARSKTLPLTRGMAGVEAVEQRRWLLSQSDLVWQNAQTRLQGQDSPWLRERRAVSVPGARVNDRSMLIFRTAEAYRRAANRAQAIDLELRWGLQSCLWLGHSWQLYRHHGLASHARRQGALLRLAQQQLLGDLPPLTAPGTAARSQLARLLLTLAALD